MKTSKLLHAVAILAGLCVTSAASAAELLANFDNYNEGFIPSPFTNGGITFSNLDIGAAGPIFAIDAFEPIWPEQSPPNTLTTLGYQPGPGGSYGRFRSMVMTFAGDASGASIDVFTFVFENHKQLTFSALLGNTVVASTTVWTDQGETKNGADVHHHLNLDAPHFNKLTLLVTDQNGVPNYSLLAFDNVRVSVPEPAGVLYLALACLLMPVRRVRRLAFAGDSVSALC